MGVPVEIIDIECVLLYFLSENFVSARWRIPRGIFFVVPDTYEREFRAVAPLREVRLFIFVKKIYIKIIHYTGL